MNVISLPPLRFTGRVNVPPPSADTAIESTDRPSAPVPATRRYRRWASFGSTAAMVTRLVPSIGSRSMVSQLTPASAVRASRGCVSASAALVSKSAT
jgi:hypothetical protein